jgi:hypothetical protein
MSKLRARTAVLAALLVLAAFLRLGWPGITEFKYDEAATLRRAMAFVREGEWPVGTTSSVAGIPQSPLKAYLLALPLAVWPDPAAAVLFLGALGVATVWMTYEMGRRYFGPPVGLIAAALLAASPWMIFYDRKLWAQNVPIFTLLFFLALFKLLVDRENWAIAVLLPALAALVGLYIGGGVMGVVLILAFALHPRIVIDSLRAEAPAKRFLWPALGAAGMVIVLLPYLIPHAGDLLAAVTSPGASDGPAVERSAAALTRIEYAAQVATGFDFHALAGDRWRDFYAGLPIPNLNGPLDGTLVALIVAGMLYVALKAVWLRVRGGREADARSTACTLLALWLWVPVAVWTASGLAPFPHRYYSVLPAQVYAAAVLLTDAAGWLSEREWGRYPPARVKRALAALGGFWLVVLTGWHVVLYGGMLRFVTREPVNGGHGPPAREVWSAARLARSLAAPDGLPLVVYTDGDDPEHEDGAAQFDALLGDLDPILVEADGVTVLPPGRYVEVRSEGGRVAYVEEKPAPPRRDEPGMARFANGVDLLDVDTGGPVRPGEELPVTLTWRIWTWPPERVDYHVTVRLADGGGAQIAQVDAAFLRVDGWRIDEVITTDFRLAVPPETPSGGDLRLVVGLYVYAPGEEPRGVDYLDVAGNPAGQQVVIPLD